METTIPVGKLLSQDDVAEKIGVQRHTLAVWRYAKRGPAFVKVGSKVAYVERDVDEWILRNRNVPGKKTKAA